MIIMPFYNIIVVPGVKFYFQGDYFRESAGRDTESGEEIVFLMLKEDKKKEDMTPEDFYPIGISGVVEDIDKDGNVGIRALNRVNIERVEVMDGSIQVETSERPDTEDMDEQELTKRFREMRASLLRYIQGTQWGIMARGYIMQWKNLSEMVATMSYLMKAPNEEKYAVLASDTLSERTERMEKIFYEFIEISKLISESENAQAASHEKIYRENAIKKQMEFLQRQLDELHPEDVSDIRKFEQKLQKLEMNEAARAEAEKVLNRMKQEGKNSHEYGLLYDYLDFVTSLSWKKEELSEIDLKKAENILDEDHYGLKKAKQRIIQQIAVMALNRKQAGSILLFVGAPGTGKTSIGQSIARALNRQYVRVRDYGGDPSSALLEVLDPEQNSTFTDHYMNVPYDLSNVLFVCTANSVDTIPEPLLNRMEVIEFPGYTASEKFQIAKRHLLPKAMKGAGIKASGLKVSDEAIRVIISDYTMEAGVRGLKKRMDALCRAAAVKLVKKEQKSVTVSPKRLKEFLDRKPIRHDHILEEKKPGIVTGLAWTQAGGDILFIEALFTKGGGNTIITGQLGDVMKESVQIAVSLVKSMYPDQAEQFKENDLHIHVPAGAVPKDGPSAGITLTTAIASLVTGRTVSPEYAMTGEVSLRGNVMPIGGLPEKLMAAQRAGISKVFIPKENVEDLEEVADEVKSKLEIIPVSKVTEALNRTGILD